MAAIVEDTCSISDAPHQQVEKEESALQTIGVPSLKLGGPSSPSQREPLCEAGGTSTAMENGSLPVDVPERHMSPAFNCVETSTNDSGVSNASSVTSDSAPHIAAEMVMPPLDVDIGQRQGYGRGGSEETGVRDGEGEKLCVAPSSPSRKEGEEEGEGASACSDFTGDLEALELSKDLHEATGGGADIDGGSSHCSSSLDSDIRPHLPGSHLKVTVSSEDAHSNGSNRLDFQPSPLDSCSSSISEGRESPDSAMAHGRRGSSQSRQSIGAGGVSPKGRSPLRSVFNRPHKKKLSYVGSVDSASQGMIAATSTTGLILEARPKTLPAKSPAEEKRHQKLYDEMVAAARKKELQKAREMVKKEKQRRQKDKVMADSLKEWDRVLPNWETMKGSRKVRELWWLGLPPGVRGKVWKRAIGNDLNISPELYQISLTRCREKLALMQSRSRSDSVGSQKGINREQSVEVIHLDVLRTFPTLGFFQEGGPYHQTLHDILGAYACYRPDVGYVQGMSFLAGVLLLNMEAGDAFVCLANLLNRSSYLAFFRVDHDLMRPYFNTFKSLLQESLPRLSAHFTQLEFSPEYYLIEWIFTLYTRTIPLDVACRVWDMFCRDGDCFLFRTALGILRMFQPFLLERNTIEEVGQFLGRLPVDIDSDMLFQHIAAINLNAKKFAQHLQQHS